MFANDSDGCTRSSSAFILMAWDIQGQSRDKPEERLVNHNYDFNTWARIVLILKNSTEERRVPY